MRINQSIISLTFVIVLLTFCASAFAQIGVSVSFGPPPLPVYEQPLCPGDGYIWTPGYWAWDGSDYYWVPGTWVLAPEVGYLWTPPWWGWENGAYLFHVGYWGPNVGFYGGINYGYGYFGNGFYGGRWQEGRFYYNREVSNVVNIRNVYNERIKINNESRVAFNGGRGGVEARPTPEQEATARDRHIGAEGAQTEHEQAARSNPELRASTNRGKPPIAATARPGEFREGAVPARAAGTPYNGPSARGTSNFGGNAPGPSRNAIHPKELPPIERPAAPTTGDAKRDQKYQQQQEKMFTKQNQERDRLQQKQEREHATLASKNANNTRVQQVEQKHQQQTQALSQRHVQQQQSLQNKQQSSAGHEKSR